MSTAPQIELPRRARNKLEKRAALVAAARALFSRQGFEETTTAQIAAYAGVGAGTLFLYFATKHDLLVAIFREEMDAVLARAVATLPKRAALLTELLHVYGAMIALHARDPELARAFVKEMLFASEPNRDAVIEFIDALDACVTERIALRQARGELDASASAQLAAENLFAIYIARLQKWLGYRDGVASEALLARLREAFALQLRALERNPTRNARHAPRRARRP